MNGSGERSLPCTGTAHRLPPWFRTSLTTARSFFRVRNSISAGGLHTVCESAACPNRNECWNAGTATFLILGDRCTRNCSFCNVPLGTPLPLDDREPERVAQVVASLGLSYAVVTSVTRDDLPDGGAGAFAVTLEAIRHLSPRCRTEVLVPDFQGHPSSLATVLDARPDVVNHNIETVPSLYASVRPGADYQRSLRLLATAREREFVTKSGIMLGLGESMDEVRSVLRELRQQGVDLLTIGQYLRPSRRRVPVKRYYQPLEFETLRCEALDMGFSMVIAGPRVRSSYRAAAFNTALEREGS